MLLPETTLTLVLRQGGAVSVHNQRLPHAVISGLQRAARVAEHTSDSSVIVVRFTETGATAIVHDRVDLLFGRTVSLDAFVPRQTLDRMQNQLADARDLSIQVEILENFLFDRLRPQSTAPLPVQAAIHMICNFAGRLSISEVARRSAMSQSVLERQVRAFAGASPKMLARLARLQHVCRLWESGKSLTRIAADAGFSDQSHLVRDFQAFTGSAPRAFFHDHSPRNLPTFYK
jgi:AraC-like DNA-binding protein